MDPGLEGTPDADLPDASVKGGREWVPDLGWLEHDVIEELCTKVEGLRLMRHFDAFVRPRGEQGVECILSALS